MATPTNGLVTNPFWCLPTLKRSRERRQWGRRAMPQTLLRNHEYLWHDTDILARLRCRFRSYGDMLGHACCDGSDDCAGITESRYGHASLLFAGLAGLLRLGLSGYGARNCAGSTSTVLDSFSRRQFGILPPSISALAIPWRLRPIIEWWSLLVAGDRTPLDHLRPLPRKNIGRRRRHSYHLTRLQFQPS